MRRVRLTWLAPTTLGVAVSLATVASCGAPAITDDPLAVRLPDRISVDATIDGGAETGSETSVAPPPDAALDTAPPITQAALCSVPDLVLCFGFEGAITDGSPNALGPAVTGVSFAPGKLGQAASFGVASAMTFAPSPAFEVAAATIEAWVKLAPNPPGDGVIFDADNRASLTILPDGTLLCKPNGVPSGGKVTVDQWTHVACVFDGVNVRAYVNGNQVGSGAGGIGSSPASGAAVGGNSPSGEPFVGAIDSFRVFKVARTAAQIAAAAAP